MNHRVFVAVVLLMSLLGPAVAQAQVPASAATPAPNRHIFDDLGMHFQAPDTFLAIGQQHLPLKALSDSPQTVAAWATIPNKGPAWQIQIAQEAFEGNLDGWELNFENQIRQQSDGLLVRHKERTALANGMPAYWVEIAFGSGFTASKMFAYVWADGSRGCQLAITGRVGELDEKQAKAALADATAVRYPAYRDPSE